MRAAWYSSNGEAREVLVVGELPTPEPAPGEVRVRLATSGVNPSDVKSRRGRALPAQRCVPHSDGAGVIDMVGAGVPESRVGQRVWIWNGQWRRPLGTAAEYIALPQEQAVPLPDNTDFAAGACLGIPALTAFRAVQLLGDIRDKTVVVTGASSAVGHYASQLAAIAGARVIGTVGSPQKAEHAKRAGVAQTIAYKEEPVADRIREMTGGLGADALIDMDFSSTSKLLGLGALKPHGVVASYGSNSMDEIAIPFRTLLFGSISLHFFLVYDLSPRDRKAAIDGLTALLEQGRLLHAVGQRFRLDDIAAAHEAVEGGKVIGNVIVDLDAA